MSWERKFIVKRIYSLEEIGLQNLIFVFSKQLYSLEESEGESLKQNFYLQNCVSLS